MSHTQSTMGRSIPSCAWLRDVAVCTENTEDTSGRFPYLMGSIGVCNPAAMGDTGAGVSRISSMMLESLPPRAVAKFQPSSLSTSNVSGPDGATLRSLEALHS